MSAFAETIRSKLEARFHPLVLTVTDDSARHAGHAGARPGGETHFSIAIVSAAFDGLPRVDRHRLIYAALDEQFEKGMHALAITALTPLEAAKD